jgi:hypothetical protein
MGSILAENYPIRYELKKGQAALQKEEHILGISIIIAFFEVRSIILSKVFPPIEVFSRIILLNT